MLNEGANDGRRYCTAWIQVIKRYSKIISSAQIVLGDVPKISLLKCIFKYT